VAPVQTQAPFRSVLFNGAEPHPGTASASMPAFFTDLNLGQVVDEVTAGYAEYELKPLFYTPLTSADAIGYRHEVFTDLENDQISDAISAFARSMRIMRDQLHQAGKLYYQLQRQRWFLDAASTYCETVAGLENDLREAPATSRGLTGFRDYLAGYVSSPGFTSLRDEIGGLYAGLGAVRYTLTIKGNRIRVRKYEDEPDYSAEVAETFAKFRQGAVKSYLSKFSDPVEMNHVEAGVLERVALLFPKVFGALERFCAAHGDYADPVITAFDREIQFYLGYLGFIAPLRRAGLSFCYPRVGEQSKQIHARDTFDLALAAKLAAEHATPVCNDVSLTGPERVIVVTGPNQGGKTTFARTFGQLHYLARLGLPVPGTQAQLFRYDKLFTHFEKQERLENLTGKLHDDLTRIRDILTEASGESLILMNEIFTSTTLQDAVYLGKEIMERVIKIGSLCVCVTFLDELAFMGETVVSMVSAVVPDNPAQRTFKIVRRPADGRAYALAIAAKHGLTYDQLKERLVP
jgi:DNA mismatch repair protein MutS